MINYNGKEYELKYTKKRVQLIERAIGKSLMKIIGEERGVFTLDQLDACLRFGIKEPTETEFVQPGEAREIGDAYLDEVGYANVVKEVLVALQRDLPFFFRPAS